MSGLGQTISRALGIGGRVPPQSIEFEQAVLGACLADIKGFERASEILLTSECFYKEGHRKIWEAMSEMYKEGMSIDLLSVKNKLLRSGHLELAGGIFYLTEISSKGSAGASIQHHSAVIFQNHLKRKLIQVGESLINDGFDDTTDPFEMMDEIKKQIDDIEMPSADFTYFSDAVNDAEVIIEQIDKGEIVLVPGMPFLPNMSFMPGEYIVIAADSGTGKTTVDLQWQQLMSNSGHLGLFNSLEMPPTAIAMKEMAHKAGISGNRLRQGGLTKDQWEAWQVLKNTKNLVLVNCFTVDALHRKIRSLKKKHQYTGTLHVGLDYIQLMQGEGAGEDKYKNISNKLKQIAIEEQIVLVVLSQLNRNWLDTKDKKPSKHNIRNSASIGNDADVVFILYRPSEVGIHEFEDGTSTRGMGVCIGDKLRSGWDGKNEWVCHIVNGQWYSEDQYNALARPVHVDVFNSLPSFKNKSDFDADELAKFGEGFV